ncbi:MAG: response regulator [Candidatus Obscuribacterales bacterium]|nr:response regulator [Candidatus Obscuribacterales bacterium]
MARILLIEDDEDIADNTMLFLEIRKHEVVHVGCGTDGLEQLRYGNFDLVLLDGNLPDMDGIDVCTTFRSEGGKLPVLMTSGRSNVEDQKRGIQAGVTSYIVKPYSLNDLEREINTLLAAV